MERTGIVIEIFVSELPIRASEQAVIAASILSGIKGGVLNPDSVSAVEWKLIPEEEEEEKGIIKFPISAIPGTACCEFDCFAAGLTECESECCEDSCTSHGFEICTRDPQSDDSEVVEICCPVPGICGCGPAGIPS